MTRGERKVCVIFKSEINEVMRGRLRGRGDSSRTEGTGGKKEREGGVEKLEN